MNQQDPNQQDPEAPSGTSSSQDSTTFFAACQSLHGPARENWIGPSRTDFGIAQLDADDHNSKNPGHEAGVVSL